MKGGWNRISLWYAPTSAHTYIAITFWYEMAELIRVFKKETKKQTSSPRRRPSRQSTQSLLQTPSSPSGGSGMHPTKSPGICSPTNGRKDDCCAVKPSIIVFGKGGGTLFLPVRSLSHGLGGCASCRPRQHRRAAPTSFQLLSTPYTIRISSLLVPAT